MDSTSADIVDSIVAQVATESEPNWLIVIIVSALVGSVFSIIIWKLQSRADKKQKEISEREQLAKVWGLALFELREAISRSLVYLERFDNNKVSLFVLFFSRTVSSDYFKLYSELPVASDMHWLYALLNQVQENLHTSRITDEITRNHKNKDPMIYAGAAADFVRTHKAGLISKFNSCLQEWNDFCKMHDIKINEKNVNIIEKLSEV